MRKKGANSAVIFIICAAICLTSSFAVLFFNNGNRGSNIMAAFSSETQRYGALNIQVIDSYTFTPVNGATIVIPDTEEKFITDSAGKTGNIYLPVNYTESLSGEPENWGTVDIFVYADGYPYHAFFNVWLEENKIREYTAVLKHGDNAEATRDDPPAKWSEALLQKYCPSFSK